MARDSSTRRWFVLFRRGWVVVVVVVLGWLWPGLRLVLSRGWSSSSSSGIDDDDAASSSRSAPWPLVCALGAGIPYAVFVGFTDKLKRSARKVGPDWLAYGVRDVTTALLRDVLGVEWSMEVDESAIRSFACVSPHGSYPLSSMFYALPSFRCDYPELEIRVGVASVLFFVPLIREFLLLFGAREVSKAAIEKLLSEGCAVGVNPGGVREMVLQRSDKEVAYVQQNLGVFRLALKLKQPAIMLVYAFGENQRFTAHPDRLQTFRLWLAEKIRVGLPFISGRFGLCLGALPVLPHPGRCTHVVGTPVDLADLLDEKDLNEAAKVAYHRYAKALIALFDTHKDRLLPPDVAEKGLDVIWIGHHDESYFSSEERRK